MSVVDLAETYKVNGPTETCVEPDLSPTRSCGDKVMIQIIISDILISEQTPIRPPHWAVTLKLTSDLEFPVLLLHEWNNLHSAPNWPEASVNWAGHRLKVFVIFTPSCFVRRPSLAIRSAAARTSWMWNRLPRRAWQTCVTQKRTPQSPSCAKPSQSSPDSASMQVEAPSLGGTKPSAVSSTHAVWRLESCFTILF